MKILVSGSGGLLGGKFVDLIQANKISFVLYDRKHPSRLMNINFDTIIHFGGLTPQSVTQNGDNPTNQEIFEANVGGTKELLRVLTKKDGLKRFINIGSAAEYGHHEKIIRETTKENPQGIYGESKLKQSTLIKEFGQKNNIQIVNLRLFNILTKGRKDKNDRRTNKSITESLGNQFSSDYYNGVIEISNKQDVRDYLDEKDAREAVLSAAKGQIKENYSVINVCSGKETSLENLVELFGRILKKSYKIIEKNPNYSVSVGDNTKAKKVLGWKPKVNLEQSIRKIIYEKG
ncbi:MAG: hypothetical protein A2172_03790 [Candidatus Woykebacteria bacterium RBG_13_40_15]|uniref:NAD(P)-binding domain-containing protein n=1 Tax=Candidatus Woykebacteria bacterium RBG_13_40_15 TaxID=1802593 RepID=A0A1G1WA71_9BACT|nr:MAG: hypothetical protein A2172_03790 [Candidatus Woykebacteria bacterium RBG_13_40_15]